MWRALSILLCTSLGSLLSAGTPEVSKEEDPILTELRKISELRKKTHPPKGTEKPSTPPSESKQNDLLTLEDYRFGERSWKILGEKREEEHPLPQSGASAPTRPVTYYHPPEPAGVEKRDPQAYLKLKEIVDPMPEEYARTYLKMKTLLNPTRKYVQVHIDKSRQRMWVYLDNDYVGDWKVSTARRGYWTPVGVYRPYTLHRMHYSRKYHNSPMPWSVFFKGGYAIHGTNAIRRLGRPASHGCIRVHPRNAKKLYQLIKRYGKQNTRIIIRG